jgi:hypothetical protein
MAGGGERRLVLDDQGDGHQGHPIPIACRVEVSTLGLCTI